MAELVLTLNAGSSSVKFALFTCVDDSAVEPGIVEPGLVVAGQVQNTGGLARLSAKKVNGQNIDERDIDLADQPFHACAFDTVFDLIKQYFPDTHIVAVGHRVVHGGIHYAKPILINEEVLAELESLTPFAPLHEPHNIKGIYAALKAYPQAPQVACFDTAFHRQHSFIDDVFALPRRYYEQGVRRYGFHGLSYEYIASELAEVAPELAAGRVIVAHLGSGASMCGMIDGRSMASTMGFSALDGLPMGTRCGEIDPGVILYMLDHEGLTSGQISDVLYNESGLLGISGLSNDMRTLTASDSLEARQAVDYFVYRIRQELGGMAVALGGLDALVFTGGIGENSACIREQVCADLDWCGLTIDTEKNASNEFDISAANSQVKVLVISTNEELVIARAVTTLQTNQEETF